MSKPAKKNVEAIYGLSPMQEGMLFHTLYDPDGGQYVSVLDYTLDGPLDPERFLAAWRFAVARHPALRTSFVWERVKKPMQVVLREVEVPFELVDARHLDAGEQERLLAEREAAERRRGFDLLRAPLLRLVLVRTGETGWRFLWVSHHLILDGWSGPLVLRDVFARYYGLPAPPHP